MLRAFFGGKWMRALLLALLPTIAFAAPKKMTTKAFPFPSESHTLKNGLKVVLVPYDSPGLVAYYTLMRVGSRNEAEPGRSGYAHFFEHMMFRGTKAFPAEKYSDIVTRAGLDTNAFTSEDETVYHLFGPSKALPQIIEIEGDRFRNLDYSEAQFKTEAGAILGEYAKSASNPEEKLDEKILETAYSAHTYRHTVIGYLADIKNMPSGFDYSREFFRRYYRPDNATVIIVGDFDKKAALSLIEKHYAEWSGKTDPVKIPVEPEQKAAARASVDWTSPTLPRLAITWHAPSANELKTAAVQDVLDRYLFGPTSELHNDLILGRQLVDSMEGVYEDHRDPFLFGVLLRVKDQKDFDAVEKRVLEEIHALASGKVDAKKLAAVRSNMKYGVILRLNTADHLAVTLARSMSHTGDVEYLNKLYAEIDKLQPNDLSAFAKKYLGGNSTTVTLTHQKKMAQGGAK
jgi:zinc protease